MVSDLVLCITEITWALDIPEGKEEELNNLISKLEERMFGITTLEPRSIVYQVAEINCVPHTSNRGKKTAGNKWHYVFMKRHPEVRLRQKESTRDRVETPSFWPRSPCPRFAAAALASFHLLQPRWLAELLPLKLQHLSCCFEVVQVPDGCTSPQATHLVA
jgi:hypothetical protein